MLNDSERITQLSVESMSIASSNISERQKRGVFLGMMDFRNGLFSGDQMKGVLFWGVSKNDFLTFLQARNE